MNDLYCMKQFVFCLYLHKVKANNLNLIIMKRTYFAVILNIVGLIALSNLVFAQTVIKGNVASQDGEPLKEVLIKIKGTDLQTLSAADGTFSIESPKSKGNLIFITPGYKDTQKRFNSKSDLVVFLNGSTPSETVVSNGYTDTALGSSKTISKDDMIKASDVREQLQGKFPGVIVSTDNGNFRVRIRGVNSFNTNKNISTTEPLYIVDGMSMDDVSNLNPNIISKISVLKDAAETSIYGTRGANGVVVITLQK